MEATKNRGRQYIVYLNVVFAVTSFLAALYLFHTKNKLLFYPTAAFFVGSILYTVFRKSIIHETCKTTVGLDRLNSQILDCIVFLGITGLAGIRYTQMTGLPIIYYWVIVGISVILVLRILIEPSTIVLLEVILLGLIQRASIWFSAPVIGQDSKLHLGIVNYILENSHVIPADISYYHWYPGTHILSSIVSLTTGIEARIGLFLSTALPAVVGTTFIYLISKKLMENIKFSSPKRVALLAALIVILAPYHVKRSSLVIAQSTNLCLVPVVLYFIIKYNKSQKRFILIGFISVIATVLNHNLTPVVLGIIVFVLSLIEYTNVMLTRRKYKYQVGLLFFIFIVVTTIQYWIISDYFQFQFGRIFSIFTVDQGLSSTASSSTTAQLYNFTLYDPLLHFATEILVYAIVITTLSYAIMHNFLKRTSDRIPLIWSIMAITVFIVLSGALFIGSGSHVFRAFPNLVFVIAPLVGFLSVSISTKRIGVLIAILLVISFPTMNAVAATGGIQSPGISPTERKVGAQIYLHSSDVAAIEYLQDIQMTALSNSYMASASRAQAVVEGRQSGLIEHSSNYTSQRRKNNKNNNIVYTTTHEERNGKKLLQNCSSIYHSGTARILDC